MKLMCTYMNMRFIINVWHIRKQNFQIFANLIKKLRLTTFLLSFKNRWESIGIDLRTALQIMLSVKDNKYIVARIKKKSY